MADKLKQIIDEIETYIRRGGGQYRDWYVGIADNPINPIGKTEFFHKVQSHRFMYIETASTRESRAVAGFFVNILGTESNLDDDQANGDCRAVFVYKKAVKPVNSIASVESHGSQEFGLIPHG